MNDFATEYLRSSIKRFKEFKRLADKAFEQLQEDKDFHYQPDALSNSIAVIIQHMSGNMISRWTNFLTEDGEKTWRKRDTEFETSTHTKAGLLGIWEAGWELLFATLESLQPADLGKTVYIRQEGQSVIDAIQRQLAHYASHVGQIIYIARMVNGEAWLSLSIPKGQSDAFNKGTQP